MAWVFFFAIDGFFHFAAGDLDLLEDVFGWRDETPERIVSGSLIDFGDGADDTVAFDLTRAEVDQRLTDDGQVYFREPEGGTLAFQGLERLELADGTWLYDLGAEAVAPLWRVYSAALGRVPDEEGLRFWAALLEEGAIAEDDLAPIFTRSPEFGERFDGLDDSEFISMLYEDVFDRRPDAEGLAFWEETLAGTADRTDLVAWFAESPENVAATAADRDGGVWVG